MTTVIKGFFSEPPCHKGVVEVIPGLLLSGKREYYPMVDNEPRVDILVPLDSIDGDAWDTGWRGEIRYIPIKDYSVAPPDVAAYEAIRLAAELRAGKRIGMFCIGGHGRTGYMASLILGFLGIEDPVAFLRKNYCRKAVETASQLAQIAEILGKPELVAKHKVIRPASGYESAGKGGVVLPTEDAIAEKYGATIGSKYEETSQTKTQNSPTCYDCMFLDLQVGNEKEGPCLLTGTVVKSDTRVCDGFVPFNTRT